jgi:hypothetical protein
MENKKYCERGKKINQEQNRTEKNNGDGESKETSRIISAGRKNNK